MAPVRITAASDFPMLFSAAQWYTPTKITVVHAELQMPNPDRNIEPFPSGTLTLLTEAVQGKARNVESNLGGLLLKPLFSQPGFREKPKMLSNYEAFLNPFYTLRLSKESPKTGISSPMIPFLTSHFSLSFLPLAKNV